MNLLVKSSFLSFVFECSAEYAFTTPVILHASLRQRGTAGQNCTGASLLQVSSKKIANSMEASNKRVLGDSWRDSVYFLALPSWRVVVAVLLLIAALLAALRCCCFRFNVADRAAVEHQDPKEEIANPIYEEEDESLDESETPVGYDMSYAFGSPFEKLSASHEERAAYDPELSETYIRSTSGNWRLLMHICGALAQFWSALIYMYWSLLTNEDDLMDCKAADGAIVRHLCYYTYACLRGFPILAANMVLVLMIRILMQWRLYYSMLEIKLVVDFADAPILETSWPWTCAFSILQGASHLVLKMVFDRHVLSLSVYWSILRKFILPGIIFFSFLYRYADVENTLIPLNRIVEREYTRSQRYLPWFTNVQAANERVFAFDIRRRDVVGETLASIGRAPTLKDIMENLSAHYEEAHAMWLHQRHRPWGLLRSLWPAAALVDRRLDIHDADTRAWLIVFAILCAGCVLTSIVSVYLLFASGTAISIRKQWAMQTIDTDLILLDVVLVWHALLIILFFFHAIRNMFYLATSDMIDTTTKQAKLLSPQNLARDIASEFSFGGSSSLATRSGSSQGTAGRSGSAAKASLSPANKSPRKKVVIG